MVPSDFQHSNLHRNQAPRSMCNFARLACGAQVVTRPDCFGGPWRLFVQINCVQRFLADTITSCLKISDLVFKIEKSVWQNIVCRMLSHCASDFAGRVIKY